jgi:hypothetical protein
VCIHNNEINSVSDLIYVTATAACATAATTTGSCAATNVLALTCLPFGIQEVAKATYDYQYYDVCYDFHLLNPLV